MSNNWKKPLNVGIVIVIVFLLWSGIS